MKCKNVLNNGNMSTYLGNTVKFTYPKNIQMSARIRDIYPLTRVMISFVFQYPNFSHYEKEIGHGQV